MRSGAGRVRISRTTASERQHDVVIESDITRSPRHPTLEPDEAVEAIIEAPGASLLVTARRLAVADEGRVILDVPLEEIRRIQFDIERQRPATFVIVPEHPQNEPQVLAIPQDLYESVAQVLASVGQALYGPATER